MIVVTGGAGFIGSNIVAALAARGQPVAVVDRLGADDKWRNLAKHELADMVAPEHCLQWLDAHAGALDAVVHMGAISSTTEADADLVIDNNFRLSLALFEWCATNSVRFIYASSAATYGDGGAGFDDDESPEALARLRPLNVYGWSKHLFDRRVARMIRGVAERPPQWVGIKFFNVYGPNEYHKGDMRSVVAKSYPIAAAGRPVTLFKSHDPRYADGGQLRDFVYVKDCADVVLWLLDHPEVNGLFNLGTGKARTFADLAAALFAALGEPVNVRYIDMPEPLRAKYQYFTEANMEKLRAAGYERAFTSIEDGVGEYVTKYLAADDRHV